MHWLFDVERNMSIEKNQKMVKICFLKVLLIDAVNIVKVVHGSTKLLLKVEWMIKGYVYLK